MLRQIEFLKRLEQLQFTGQLVQTDTAGQQWTLYLAQGQIIYATGGQHPVRRWRRHLLTYCPRIQTYRLAWQIDLAKVSDHELHWGWEYALLRYWVTQQRITQQQADQFIQSAITEVIFDINQSCPVTDQLYPSQWLLPSLNPVQIEAVVEAAELEWQHWQALNLAGLSPNQAPVIQHLKNFQQWSVELGCESWVRLIDGQRTLRDLAVLQHQAVSKIASQLQPCVQLGLIEFTQVADLPGLVFQRSLSQPSPSPDTGPKPLIACIDDSTMVRKLMEELLTSSGYQFLGIDDPLRAIGLLLTRKPEFIFLDLVMPNVNGYEICEKLRKLSCFRNTPIVILTSNDGYANRLRSNFVGATDFLSKPLNAEALLSMVGKHLKPAKPIDPLSIKSQA
jgi:two-component system, chemotaxis family, response regulator PixG